MGLRIGGKIERVNGKELSYREFEEKYLKKNEPVLLTGLMEDWKACEDWVTESGAPDLSFLSAHFVESEVMVADCFQREFTDQKRTEISFLEFIEYWRDYNSNIGEDDRPLLYLKDWHFVKEYPSYIPYTTPSFFHDDWLNIYLDSYRMRRDQINLNCSDYRFVYMGPKGTWTPLHADVFRSYSWSANVCGKKHWYLLPPSQSHLLFDQNQRNTVYDIFDEVCEDQFPGFRKTVWWKCVQEKGDIIFVPSGWFHQVHNLEDTISINHNWFNAHNLDFVRNLLLNDYCEAKDYIEDIREICDDFEWLCQRNLAANTGMNFYDFFIFLIRFTLASLFLLYHLKAEKNFLFSSSAEFMQRLTSNLVAIYKVSKCMESVEAFTEDSLSHFPGEDWRSLCDINGIIREERFEEFSMAIIKSIGWNDEPEEWNFDVSIKSFLSFCSSKASLNSPFDLSRLIEKNFLDPDGVCYGLDRSLFAEISLMNSHF